MSSDPVAEAFGLIHRHPSGENFWYGMDVKRHIGGSQHQKLAKVVAATTSIDTFYVSGSTEVKKVTNAEVLFTGFILEHNLPFECSSHAGPVFRKMFPDSKIAAEYGVQQQKLHLSLIMLLLHHFILIFWTCSELNHLAFLSMEAVIQELKACIHLL